MLKRIIEVSLILALIFTSFVLGQVTAKPITVHDANPTIERLKPELPTPQLPKSIKS